MAVAAATQILAHMGLPVIQASMAPVAAITASVMAAVAVMVVAGVAVVVVVQVAVGSVGMDLPILALEMVDIHLLMEEMVVLEGQVMVASVVEEVVVPIVVVHLTEVVVVAVAIPVVAVHAAEGWVEVVAHTIQVATRAIVQEIIPHTGGLPSLACSALQPCRSLAQP